MQEEAISTLPVFLTYDSQQQHKPGMDPEGWESEPQLDVEIWALDPAANPEKHP